MIGRGLVLIGCAGVLACGSSNSGAGTITGPDGGTCDVPIEPSALTSNVQHLGVKTVNDHVTFNVPAGTGSVTIVQQAKSAGLTITVPINGKSTTLDNSAVPASISVPGGTTAFDIGACTNAAPDGGAPPPSSDCANPYDPETALAYYGGGTPVTAAFTIPNTSGGLSLLDSNGALPAGAWSFDVNDYANMCGKDCTKGASTSDTYDISIVTKPVAGATFDVAFYIVGALAPSSTAPPLTAASAPSDSRVQRMVSSYKSIFASAGITVGNVAYYDVSADDSTRFGTTVDPGFTGPCDELSQMFTLSGAHPGNTMNIFLVQSIRSGSSSGGTVVGIDGSIPGPASFNGTVHSGAVVTGANLYSGQCLGGGLNVNCGADQVAYTAAHETGHFMGLFHTTESTGDFFDTLDDTPKCPCISCNTTSGVNCTTYSASTQPSMSVGMCDGTKSAGCAGANDLMFWLFDRSGTAQGNISAQQVAVMKASPLIH